jgi:gluconolactonase
MLKTAQSHFHECCVGRAVLLTVTVLALPIAATEGPAVDAAGNIYFCDGSRIVKQAVDGTRSIFRESSNRANGLVFDDRGRLLAAELGDRTGTPRVTRTDIETGKVEVLVNHYEGKGLNSPNDITLDGEGRIYFTHSGYKAADAKTGPSAVYRIDPDLKVTRILKVGGVS